MNLDERLDCVRKKLVTAESIVKYEERVRATGRLVEHLKGEVRFLELHKEGA